MSDPTPSGEKAAPSDEAAQPPVVAEPRVAAPDSPGSGEADDPQARQWALVAHLSGLVILIGIPGIFGPLVVWLIKRDEMPFVDRQGKGALNFQLTLLIYMIAVGAVMLVGVVLSTVLVGVPILFAAAVLAGLLWILGVIFPILAAVAAQKGQDYPYPLTIRFFQ